MVYNPESYRHELDQRAFDLLNSFPKFVKVCEVYLANYQEIVSKIDAMSNYIRLSERQLPEVYNLLPPICEKLGIEVPDLYYIKDKHKMNACTGGTTKPYILVTSKLVEELNAEQLSSVLAHECGHIACKHTLYHSMASYLIGGIDNSPLGQIPIFRKLLTTNMIKALLFWYRCSELSADRAAVLCDGNANIFVDTLLKIKGYDDNINRDEFINQALDLKEFINGSKSNKVMEQMLNQGDSHPCLATRVYESYEWAKSEQFQLIRDGRYQIITEDANEEQEVVSAEVTINAERKNHESIEIPEGFNIDAELERVNKELERYTNNADKFDYAWAIMSGIFSGIIDSMFVGQCSYGKEGIRLNHKQVNNFIQEYAKARGKDSERLKDAIGYLEHTFKVAQDNIWKGEGIGVSAVDHHLADLAHHPTPIGLISAIVVQFLRVGTFVNDKGEWYFVPVKTTLEDLKNAILPAVVTGVFNWVATLAEKTYENETGEEIPKALHRLIHLAASSPIIIEVAKCADNWFGHLVSDMGGSKNTAGGGMGIPGIFVSLLYEMASLPILKDSGLPSFVDDLYQNKKIDLRQELTIYKNLGKQAIPVIFNEVYTRLGYFMLHLMDEALEHGLKEINWNKVIPFNNRAVDRMMMISTMTLNMADTADAAVHAALESCGNWVLFAGSYVTRLNYVGAGRAALAIVKEISNEKKECELIHQKLILTEAKTEEVIEQMEAYRNALELRVSEYLAEDLEEFINGFDYMKEGLMSGNSDLVIKGNVVIQKVLGREPQFTNQKEFDELMASDEAIIL